MAEICSSNSAGRSEHIRKLKACVSSLVRQELSTKLMLSSGSRVVDGNPSCRPRILCLTGDCQTQKAPQSRSDRETRVFFFRRACGDDGSYKISTGMGGGKGGHAPDVNAKPNAIEYQDALV